MNEVLILTLVTFACTCISVGAAVYSLLFSRRGADSELKGDVEELALLVDRMGKAQRREKMSRIRQSSLPLETPPATPEALPTDVKSMKDELRKRMFKR